MSFGYAVGDVIAVLGLAERVAIEIRSYRDAPRHFQQLQAELDMHMTTIKTILSIKPEDAESQLIIERIRAIALLCRMPLQRFIDQMHGKEHALGHRGTTTSMMTHFHSVGTRLHWSLVGRKDVEELRCCLLSSMLSINILQGRLHEYVLSFRAVDVPFLTCSLHLRLHIQKLGPEIARFAKTQSHAFVGLTSEVRLLRQTAKETPEAISDLRRAIIDQDATGRLDAVAHNMDSVQTHIKSINEAISLSAIFGKKLGGRVAVALTGISSLMAQLQKSVQMYVWFSPPFFFLCLFCPFPLLFSFFRLIFPR